MTRTVYFDRSAWDALVRDEDSDETMSALVGGAVARGDVRLPVSYMVLDETLPLLRRTNGTGAKQLALIQRLGDWRRGILKVPGRLFEEEARAFQAGVAPPSPFEPATELIAFVAALPDLVARDPGELEAVIGGIRAGKREFVEQLRPLRARALEDKAAIPGTPTSLDRGVHLGVPILARGVLEAVGIEITEDQLGRLIQACPTLYAYAAVHSAYVHAQAITGRAPDKGDSYDLLHAVTASAADEFVSEDRHLRGLAAAAKRGGLSGRSVLEFVATLE